MQPRDIYNEKYEYWGAILKDHIIKNDSGMNLRYFALHYFPFFNAYFLNIIDENGSIITPVLCSFLLRYGPNSKTYSFDVGEETGGTHAQGIIPLDPEENKEIIDYFKNNEKKEIGFELIKDPNYEILNEFTVPFEKNVSTYTIKVTSPDYPTSKLNFNITGNGILDNSFTIDNINYLTKYDIVIDMNPDTMSINNNRAAELMCPITITINNEIHEFSIPTQIDLSTLNGTIHFTFD